METNTIGCEACRDLLPLYAEGEASAESKALVEAHWKNCESCRTELIRLQTFVPMLNRRAKKAMRTMKQKLRLRRILIGIGSALVMFGLFAFLLSYRVPVKTPPDDLKFSVADGVFTATSAVDSQFTGVRLSSHKAQDGSDIFLVTISMDNPLMRMFWPALNRKIYPTGPSGFWYPEHGMKIVCPLAVPPAPELLLRQWIEGLGFPEPPEPAELPELPDFNPEGKGLWRVYFIQARDGQKQRIREDEAAGRLTEASMKYATLVWEETIV